MLLVGNTGEGNHGCWVKVKKGDWCPAAMSGVLPFSGWNLARSFQQLLDPTDLESPTLKRKCWIREKNHFCFLGYRRIWINYMGEKKLSTFWVVICDNWSCECLHWGGRSKSFSCLECGLCTVCKAGQLISVGIQAGWAAAGVGKVRDPCCWQGKRLWDPMAHLSSSQVSPAYQAQISMSLGLQPDS